MQPMFLNHVAPRLETGDGVIRTAAVHQLGLGESRAAALLGAMMDRSADPLVGTTVKDAIVTARVRASGSAERVEREFAATVAEIERRWRPYVFGRNEVTLPMAVGEMLRERRATLATAESCTGGLLGSLIVGVAGSSDYYRGGWITYDNAMKQSCLDVPEAMLAAHGAVSEEVALAMAEGARRRSGASVGAAITGIAGPGGATPGKPVGTVFIAVALGRNDAVESQVRRFEFSGERDVIRDRAAKAALQMTRFALLGVGANVPLLWEAPAPTRQRVPVR
jgi:nicotinamide-nucleotide amidase